MLYNGLVVEVKHIIPVVYFGHTYFAHIPPVGVQLLIPDTVYDNIVLWIGSCVLYTHETDTHNTLILWRRG